MRCDSRDQRGMSLIAAIFIIIILAFMGTMFVSLISTSNITSINDLQSTQAVYIAEGGWEYILENRAFPNYSLTAATNLGAGSFSVATPAYLTGAVAIGNTIISVNSTSGFAASGRIVIDSEVIVYTGITANSFTGAGPAAAIHASGNAVYPVTRAASVLANNCTTANVQVDSVANFLIPGIVAIGSEYLYCTGTAAGPARFTGCSRCYQGSSSSAHAIGDNIFQYIITSTGTVGSAQRGLKLGVLNTVSGAGVAFDRASTSAFTATNTFTWNHLVAGNNRVLLVGISTFDQTGVSMVRYSGTALTRVGAGQTCLGNRCRVEIWQLTAPALGTNSVTVTLSGNASGVAGAVSLTEVDQTTPIEASSYSNASGVGNATPAVTVTTLSNNAWLMDTLAAETTDPATPAGGQIARWNGSNQIRGAGSTKGPMSPAGATSMNWTLGSSSRWAIGAVAVKPANTGGGISFVGWQEVVR